ncbi:MAG: hypothetical protein WD577_06025 [Bacteroidales bacterium]
MNKITLIAGFLCTPMHAFSQGPGYAVSFHQIFDNREYFSDYGFPQTIFGARLNNSLLFELDTMHSFAAGFSYLYEHGSTIAAVPPQVNLYYSYSAPELNMAFGAFPRNGRLDLPRRFLNDTLNYYRPNVEGAWISFAREPIELSGFIDWTGRVTEERRERFLAGLDSKFSAGGFFLQGTFLMYHNARSYSDDDVVPLQDNGIFSVIAGYARESVAFPFTMETSAGYLSSYNRYRPGDFSIGRGVMYNIDLRYTIFGLDGVYYFGTPIVFEYGDPFYRSGNYGRLDLFADPFSHPRIESRLGWSFHLLPGEGIHHSQQLLINVTF